MSDFFTTNNYAWRASVSSDLPFHGKKSDFGKLFGEMMEKEGCEKFIGIQSAGFSTLIEASYFDVMNSPYQAPKMGLNCKTMIQYMSYKIMKNLWGFLACRSVRSIKNIFPCRLPNVHGTPKGS